MREAKEFKKGWQPKDGWKYATKDEMQMSAAQMIGMKLCMNPYVIYTEVNKLDIYLPSVIHLLIPHKDKAALANTADAMFVLVMDNNSQPLLEICKTYEKLSEKENEG